MKTVYTFALLCMMVFIPRSFLKIQGELLAFVPEPPLAELVETPAKPLIIPREEWYDNDALLSQDTLRLGQSFDFTLLGRDRTRKVRDVSYSLDELRDSIPFRWIVLHHTEPLYAKPHMSAFAQGRFIRDAQIVDSERGYSDVAYHFLITDRDTILEGRPLHRMGTHAGRTLEGMRGDFTADPDYLAIGIAVIGDFDRRGEPSSLQAQSLRNLLLWLCYEYEISEERIIFHSEVIEKIVLPAGHTPRSTPKSCPGAHFLTKECLLEI